VKKKMVHGLSIPLTHATSIHHNDMSLPEVINGILPKAADHAKKAALKGALVRKTLFQGKLHPSLQTMEH
jgi:hypothetical protein